MFDGPFRSDIRVHFTIWDIVRERDSVLLQGNRRVDFFFAPPAFEQLLVDLCSGVGVQIHVRLAQVLVQPNIQQEIERILVHVPLQERIKVMEVDRALRSLAHHLE